MENVESATPPSKLPSESFSKINSPDSKENVDTLYIKLVRVLMRILNYL
jgi:hypothetical protein